MAVIGSSPSFLIVFCFFFSQSFVNLAGFVFICKAGSNLPLTWQGRVWHFSVCCLICAVLTLLFCSFSWCNYCLGWCNCCFAYLVGNLDRRENQAVYLASLQWLLPATTAAAGVFAVKAIGNKKLLVPFICNHRAVLLSYQQQVCFKGLQRRCLLAPWPCLLATSSSPSLGRRAAQGRLLPFTFWNALLARLGRTGDYFEGQNRRWQLQG